MLLPSAGVLGGREIVFRSDSNIPLNGRKLRGLWQFAVNKEYAAAGSRVLVQ